MEAERLANSVEFRMLDDRWIGNQQHGRVLEQEPQKGSRARQKVCGRVGHNVTGPVQGNVLLGSANVEHTSDTRIARDLEDVGDTEDHPWMYPPSKFTTETW